MQVLDVGHWRFEGLVCHMSHAVTIRVQSHDISFLPRPLRFCHNSFIMSSLQNQDEYQYLNLIKRVLDTGDTRPDRTGTGTISIFAPPSLQFSVADSTRPLPLFLKNFFGLYMDVQTWKFYRKSWDGNGSKLSKAFLEAQGFGASARGWSRPCICFQWRHFGADYVDCETNYTGQGVDQLRECIKKIKETPQIAV